MANLVFHGPEAWISVAFGLVLLLAAAGLMASHLRSWRRFREMIPEIEPDELDFRRRQFRRRMQTSTMLGILAVAILIGHFLTSPPLPRSGFILFWGIVLFLLGWVALLALVDVVHTSLYFGRVRDRYRLEETRLKAQLRQIKGRRRNGRG